jgi:FtsH-binding integral membrane protein
VATDPRSVLTTIYTALALGVGVLAVVAYILGPSIGSTFGRSLFRWIWLAAALVCTLGAGVVRGRASSVSPDRCSLLPAAIITWSLAEAQALLAAVGFFLTGDRPLLVAGLALFIFLMARHRPSTFLAGS